MIEKHGSGVRYALEYQSVRVEQERREALAVMWLAVLQGHAQFEGHAAVCIKEIEDGR
jgi:hypothetical protein